MPTATATRGRKRKNALPMRGRAARQNALNMLRGDNTFYQPGIVDAAREAGVPVWIVNDAGNRVLANAGKPPRQVHRPDLTGVFSDAHDRAGEGKYIDQSALSDDGRTVTGANLVNPYLPNNGSYHSVIAAFQSLMPRKVLANLVADVRRSKANGEHLVWRGDRDENDAVAVSPWVTQEDLWRAARELNTRLVRRLNSNQSQREAVREHLGAKAKFYQNLDVMRRARRIFYPSSGEVDFCGGATPYSMPLEQCGFAIDMCWLVDNIDADGNETGQYYYRLAVGRQTPWTLYKRQADGLDSSAGFAYLTSKLQSRAESFA